MAASDTIEAEGHLIDSGHLSAIFDKIIEFKAQYEILKFDIGRTNDDASRIEMRISAPDGHQLDELLQALTTWGCHPVRDRKSTRLNSSHMSISYAVFCLKKKTKDRT